MLFLSVFLSWPVMSVDHFFPYLFPLSTSVKHLFISLARFNWVFYLRGYDFCEFFTYSRYLSSLWGIGDNFPPLYRITVHSVFLFLFLPHRKKFDFLNLTWSYLMSSGHFYIAFGDLFKKSLPVL